MSANAPRTIGSVADFATETAAVDLAATRADSFPLPSRAARAGTFVAAAVDLAGAFVFGLAVGLGRGAGIVARGSSTDVLGVDDVCVAGS